MLFGFTSVASLAIYLIALLGVAIVFGVMAVKRFRDRDHYRMWQGIFGAFGFGLLPYSVYLGPFQYVVLLMLAAASIMGLRGHIA